MPPGQVVELAMRAGLVPFHDQVVARVLAGDQELRVVALGMQGVRGNGVPGQVQWFQQRGERGDLTGLAVRTGLPRHCAGLLIDDGQQVRRLPVAAGVPGAPDGLAVHGHRPPVFAAVTRCLVSGPQTAREPGSDRGVEGGGIY